MNKILFDALQIKYIKLRFTIAFSEDSVLPKDKVSALRGGMGEMLLCMNCIRDRQCEVCDFETECIVQKTLYSKFEIKPDFVTSEASIGYILECENYQEHFRAGERINFYLILFGKTVSYFHQFFQAFSNLGKQDGIGKNHVKFHIMSVKSMEGMPVYEKGMLNMNNYVIHILHDYITFRNTGFDISKNNCMIIFDTPLTLKYQNKYLDKFQMEAIVAALRRRLFMLNCYEGIKSDIMYQNEDDSVPKILWQKHCIVGMGRYSMRKNEKMLLRGLKGYALVSNLTDDIMSLLLVGELMHIGKNTSFGFGRFHIQAVDSES